jgi:hypothetical protein
MADLNSREALLATVRALRNELDGIVAGVDEEQAKQVGSFDAWSFKDTIAHLTSWRLTTAARLEAGLSGDAPAMPWPASLDVDDVDEGDVDEINRWFYESNQDKPLADILRESGETFDRLERAIVSLPEADLLEPDRFPWSQGWALGPGVIDGTLDHYHEHEAGLRTWLDRPT